MTLTMADALRMSSLKRCTILAGRQGLSHRIHSVNSFDAPDAIHWLKPGELVLTSGYVFKNDTNFQVNLIRELTNRRCAGLGIKTDHFWPHFSEQMLQTADDCNFPLLEIPGDLPLSDLTLSLLNEMFIRKNHEVNSDSKNNFFASLLNNKLFGRDMILAQGETFGLLPEQTYACIYTNIDAKQMGTGCSELTQIIAEAKQDIGVHIITVALDHMVLIVQAEQTRTHRMSDLVQKIAQYVLERFSKQIPDKILWIGMGPCQEDVLKISDSFEKAQTALQLGAKLSNVTDQRVCNYESLQSYAVLHYVPEKILHNFLTDKLHVIMTYDRENNTNLLQTLDLYLAYAQRVSEVSRQLNVHRNTVNFRISKIKELLGNDLRDGETIFQLQMALRIAQLVHVDSPSTTLTNPQKE